MSESRPHTFEERYRLYVDESGDHVFRNVDQPQHRFLCLLGCWFKNPAYLAFQKNLELLKQKHFPHNPDEPVILHREDMINRRRWFRVLINDKRRKDFDLDLLAVIRAAEYSIVGVVVDKLALRSAYQESAAHPYHLAMGFLLQRYVGFLNHINRVGDIMAESRGGREDRLLAESYTRAYERGAWMVHADSFQAALTSRELKLKNKQANIAGLQLADMLGRPVKQYILRYYKLQDEEVSPFTQEITAIAASKFNAHLYDGRVEGYGFVLYPMEGEE